MKKITAKIFMTVSIAALIASLTACPSDPVKEPEYDAKVQMEEITAASLPSYTADENAASPLEILALLKSTLVPYLRESVDSVSFVAYKKALMEKYSPLDENTVYTSMLADEILNSIRSLKADDLEKKPYDDMSAELKASVKDVYDYLGNIQKDGSYTIALNKNLGWSTVMNGFDIALPILRFNGSTTNEVDVSINVFSTNALVESQGNIVFNVPDTFKSMAQYKTEKPVENSYSLFPGKEASKEISEKPTCHLSMPILV